MRQKYELKISTFYLCAHIFFIYNLFSAIIIKIGVNLLETSLTLGFLVEEITEINREIISVQKDLIEGALETIFISNF